MSITAELDRWASLLRETIPNDEQVAELSTFLTVVANHICEQQARQRRDEHIDIETALQFLVDADRHITWHDPYNEDGYCEFCGNGHWKHHAPWCLWQETRDINIILTSKEQT